MWWVLALKMVAHFLSVAIPVVVCATAFLNFQFFSWHPVCMVLAYAFLMSEAIMLFSPSSSLISSASRSTKITYHGYMMFGALVSAVTGFCVIYLNKERHEKPHFTSPHGIAGVATVGYTAVQVLAGVGLKYGAGLVAYFPRDFTLAKWKLYHALSGCFLFILACAALLGGLNSAWFQTHTHPYVWGLTMVAGLMLTFIAVGHMSEFVKTKRSVSVKQQPPTK